MDGRIALDLGIIKIHWYGIIITLGMMLAVWIAMREFARRGENPDIMGDGAIWVIGLGIVGARIYHIVSSPNDGSGTGLQYYLQNPLEMLATWKGGIGIYGGIIGGVIGIIYVIKRAKAPLMRAFDSIVPGVLIAQAIGRWGNFVNQELYGGPTGSSWFGVLIDPQYRIRTGKFDFTDMTAYPPETRFHPTFLYESVWNFVGFLLLMWLARTKQYLIRKDGSAIGTPDLPLRDGDIGPLFLMWYGIGRAWVELFFRPDAWTIGSLPTAVWVSLAGIIAGVIMLVLNRRRLARIVPATVASPPDDAAPPTTDVAPDETHSQTT